MAADNISRALSSSLVECMYAMVAAFFHHRVGGDHVSKFTWVSIKTGTQQPYPQIGILRSKVWCYSLHASPRSKRLGFSFFSSDSEIILVIIFLDEIRQITFLKKVLEVCLEFLNFFCSKDTRGWSYETFLDESSVERAGYSQQKEKAHEATLNGSACFASPCLTMKLIVVSLSAVHFLSRCPWLAFFHCNWFISERMRRSYSSTWQGTPSSELRVRRT